MQDYIIFLGQIIFILVLVSKIKSNLLLQFGTKGNIGFYIFALIFLPSTIFHEFAHALMCLVCRTKITKISLWPTRVSHENSTHFTFGYVEFATNSITRKFFIALAPFYLGIITICLLFYYFDFFTASRQFLFALLNFYVLFALLPSKKDLDIAKSGILISIVLIMIALLIAYFLQLNIFSYSVEILQILASIFIPLLSFLCIILLLIYLFTKK